MSFPSNIRPGVETISLVPFSGIQFLSYGFDMAKTPRFMARSFIEHIRQDATSRDGTVPIDLRPGWNDENPEGDPPFSPVGRDNVYDVSPQKALEPFLGRWVPAPFLAMARSRDDFGHDLLQRGPTNWCRVRVTVADPNHRQGYSHRVVFAFDTELLERRENRAYVAPSPRDALAEQEFSFAYLFRDLAGFLSDRRPLQGGGEINQQEWVDRWLDELFVEFKAAQRGGRLPRPDEREPLEHAARYITFLQFLHAVLPIPRVKLIDTLSNEPTVRPVDVDLVLDIGNSRTCGMLIENFPNQEKVDLGNSYALALRDLEEPYRVFAEPFESDVQLAQAHFGKEHLSRFSTRTRAFFWPSLVRVGPEAARYRERAEGTEGASGMSSPKRYLCDVESVNQEWRFQLEDYGTNREPPTIDRAARRFVNFRGDVLRQVAEERKFYEQLAWLADRSELDKPSARLTYSRSAFFSFLVAEILCQALTLINNPQMRGTRGEKDTPRRLRRVILTLPTAIPVREQRLLRSRTLASVKLIWDLMGWTEQPPPGLQPPEVHASWDEASCAQFVYLYSEIAQKFGGAIAEFLKLAGKPRPFVEPERRNRAAGAPEASIRVASVDVGGGTTDLMITTYYVEKNRAIVPVQTFREGFRIAGEDVLREVIQSVVLPAIERHLKACGLNSARELLVDRFGADRANMAQQDKHLRRQFVLRVLKPAALALLSAYECAESPWSVSRDRVTIAELLRQANKEAATPASRVVDYLDRAAFDWGARNFSVREVATTIDFATIRLAVEAVLGEPFDNIAEAIHHFDCDVVLLAGRPSRLPATVDLFVNKLATDPDRLMPLSNYPAGNWYPYGGRSRFRIEDPKTATVVGCMLCALSENQITNFTLFSNRLAMRSTANYIGMIERDGKMLNANVLFASAAGETGAAPQSAEVNWFAPMPLGSRQLAVERWVATPMYRIKTTGGMAKAMQKPVTIRLERQLPEELADYDTRHFSAEEAKKEEIRIVEATARDGANVTRSFGLFLDTFANEDGYWLDTGILNIA
jgi:hypothetical protein